MNRSIVLGICAAALLVCGPVLANSYTAQPGAPAGGAAPPTAPAPYTAITPPGFSSNTVAPVAPRSAAARTDTDRQLEEIDRSYKKELEAITKSLRDRTSSTATTGRAGTYAFMDLNLKDILKKEAKKAFGDKLKVFDNLKKKSKGKLDAMKAKMTKLNSLEKTLDSARASGKSEEIEKAASALHQSVRDNNLNSPGVDESAPVPQTGDEG